MSSDAIITVENLGKKYSIRHQTGEGYRTLRDVIAQKMKAPFHFLRRTTRPQDNGQRDLQNSPVVSSQSTEEFWALRDVSFEVRQGEVVGIIGRNGAGKSTLLKILSRITEPTTGRVKIRGRVSSLLEVGTGFHPELTGRENVFLNGAILGMGRAEIRRKFDEIVAFAEIEKFLDTPVKHYSSGMYVRLAFAVAAHLEPEILVVDEVLAVGDVAFQKKCLWKMGDVVKEGRTVVFVSHNMMAIRSLCQRCVLMDAGVVLFSGGTGPCIDRYLDEFGSNLPVTVDTGSRPRAPVIVDDSLRITQLRLVTSRDQAVIGCGEPLVAELSYRCVRPIANVVFVLTLATLDGVRILDCRSLESLGVIRELTPETGVVECTVNTRMLTSGVYSLSAGARCGAKNLDAVMNVMSVEFRDPRRYESLWLEGQTGLIRADSHWIRRANGSIAPR